jgi:hypothetical protein
MAPRGPAKCQCCLKILKSSESRVPSNNKTRIIFENLIGFEMAPGVVCGKCNVNLLTFNAFSKEITRKHEEERIMKNRSQIILAEELHQAYKSTLDPHPATETNGTQEIVKVKQEGTDEEDAQFIIQEIDTELKSGQLFVTDLSPEEEQLLLSDMTQPEVDTPQPEEYINDDDDDDDVIVVPQEPQVPIDLDEISDEPEQKKAKVQEETTMYKCEHCTAVSSKKEIIVSHIRHSHTFPCTECGKVFPSTERLKHHEMRNHSLLGNKRKQSLKPTNLTLEDRLKFRLKAKPYGRPWHKANKQN